MLGSRNNGASVVVAALHIHLLGELEIRRGERAAALPPSRKTRALLAYLVMTGRAHRREHLCELLWDIADDPRAELRWSLSKLRGVLDDDGLARIAADREEVAFHPHGAIVDVLEVRRALASRSLHAVVTDELERLARYYRGELLEGLDLPDFDAYQAWCIAQREDARAERVRLLGELVRRFSGEPARAVEHARDRALLDPHDTDARVELIEILVALGRRDEARAQYSRGRRLAGDGRGDDSLARLDAAWRLIEARAGSRAVAAPSMPLETSADRGDVDNADEPGNEPPVTSPLVGLRDELAALDAALARVEAVRRFGAVVLSGALGAGKSRLLHEWLHRATRAGAAVATAVAFEADAGRPYGPWLDALARLPGAERRPRPELARLARTGGADEATHLDRDRLFEEVADAIVAAAAERPIVIAIDDAHWLDPSSSTLLVHIARRCDRLPVLLVLLARPGELDDNLALARSMRALRQLGVVDERELAPLDEAETAALVRSVRRDADTALLYARSGGNPLFALELARASADDGGVPHSVVTAIRDRLAALPEDAAVVLRWGAVMRRGFAAHELEVLAGMPAELVVDMLELLVRRALLVRADGDAGHGFAHELVRQVVYDMLSEPRRRLMHRRVAEWLAARVERGDDQVDIADVAHHAAAAHDAALATRTCLAAARRSVRMFANADAHALARRGLRHAEALADPERTRYSLELFETMLAARRPDDGERVARQLEALAERALDLGALEHARLGYHLLAYVRWERGASLDAHRHMRHAQMISRSGTEPEQIVGMAEAARCLVLLERDLPEAEALAREAAARGRIAGVEPPATFAALGMLHMHCGRLAEAAADLERSLALARVRRDRQDEYQALEQLAALALARGDLVGARRRAEELLQLGARFADGSEAPFARGLVALVRCAQGEEATEVLGEALGALAAVDAKHRLSYLASRAAWLESERGAGSRAVELAERALQAAQPLERATEIALARAVLARAGQGDAAAHLDAIAVCWAQVSLPVRTLLGTLVGSRVQPPVQEAEEVG